jgi:hypothetical protein
MPPQEGIKRHESLIQPVVRALREECEINFFGDHLIAGRELMARLVMCVSVKWRLAVGLAVLAASVSVAAGGNAYAGSVGRIAGIPVVHRATRIISPRDNQLVGRGGVRVVVDARASLAVLHLSVNGHNVNRYFHRAGSQYRAELRPGRGLWPGIDQLIVVTGADTEVDSVTFIVARQVPGLLTLTDFRIGGPEAPVLVGATVASGSTLEAWVNGHRDDAAFLPQDGRYAGRIGASDWLHPGRNQLVLVAYRTAPSQRAASFTIRTEKFGLDRGQLVAAAGRDLFVDAGDFVRLDGTAAAVGDKTAGHVTYRWNVIQRPRGGACALTAPASQTPYFQPATPGTYVIKMLVTGTGGASSADTVTVTARPAVPPIGAKLDSAADDRGTIMLDGKPVPDTTEPCTAGCAAYASYAVFNRVSLQLVVSGYVPRDPAGMASLIGLATRYNAAPGYLMVVNLNGPLGLADARRLFGLLGVAGSSVSDADLTRSTAPYSIIGIPGSPAGSAFVARGSENAARRAASMSGFLRWNPASTTGYFEFVFADQVAFDTDVRTTPRVPVITMKVGDATYAHPVPRDGSSGFFVVRLNSQTLAPEAQSLYVTNGPHGSQHPDASKRLADNLSAAVNAGGRQLVLLQSFHLPSGTSAGWLAAATAIGKLGGTAQVFAQLNQRSPDEPYGGSYAFAGRPAMNTSAAESSAALTGRAADGKLAGLLGRDRDSQYEPLAADPSGTVNFDLVRIVNGPSAPGGGFPEFTPAQAAAAAFLGRDVHVIGVCDPDPAVPCDVRRQYYESMGAPWSTILTRLGSAGERACAEPHPRFTTADCNAARVQLADEISFRNRVAAYFGPAGLQGPFGSAQVAALVDTLAIASQISQAVRPPEAANATSRVLTLLSSIAAAGGNVGPVCPPCAVAAGGVSAAFTLAAYLTQANGSPDLSQQITARAAQLGSTLYERYRRASEYMTTEAKIIISDWAKMREVVAAIPTRKWKLGDPSTTLENIRLATRQVIYQALVPLAYPVLYDLGTGITDARHWKCLAGVFEYDKRLFQRTDAGAQMTWRMTNAPYAGQSHVIAVGARRTIHGGRGAYVPAPPDSLTGLLFRAPDSPQGGVGLYKLQFYSPQNSFHLFHRVLQQEKKRSGGFGFHTCQTMPNPPGNSG